MVIRKKIKEEKMMYFFYLLVLCVPLKIYTTSWNSAGAKDIKQSVNFAGKITTHQGQEYIVDNISIQGKYKQIPLRDKPAKHAEAQLNKETKRLEIQLEENPNISFAESFKDLDETDEIKIPSPNTSWMYQQKGRHQKLEFIEVEWISNGGQKSYHLVDPKTPLYCDVVDPAGPQEKRIPLSAVETLKITGYTYRDIGKNKDKKNNATECHPCPTCPNGEKQNNPLAQ